RSRCRTRSANLRPNEPVPPVTRTTLSVRVMSLLESCGELQLMPKPDRGHLKFRSQWMWHGRHGQTGHDVAVLAAVDVQLPDVFGNQFGMIAKIVERRQIAGSGSEYDTERRIEHRPAPVDTRERQEHAAGRVGQPERMPERGYSCIRGQRREDV